MSATTNESQTAPQLNPGQSGSYDQTFVTSGQARLHVNNPRGYVRVSSWERPEIQIRAEKRRDGSAARYEATQVVLTQDGDTVIARTVLDPASSLAQRGFLNEVATELLRAFADLLPTNSMTTPVDYDVKVPVDTEIDLQGVSANLTLVGTRGAFKVRSVSGQVTVTDVEGDADLGNVSGDIKATGLNGRVHVEEVSGSARLAGNVTTLVAKSVSGDLEISSPLSGEGTYDGKTVSGGATFEVPAATGAMVYLRGVSPDFSCDLPHSVTRDKRGPGHREWQGQVGSGGAVIRFQTVSGQLEVRRCSDNAEQPLVAGGLEPGNVIDSSSTSTSADVEESAELQVLNALERGDLSVDEALRQIAKLRGER